MSFEQQVAKQQSGNDLMPAAPVSEAEQSKTQFTSKGTIPPPLTGEQSTGKSASDVAFGADPAWSKAQADALRAARDRVHGQQLALLMDDKCTTLVLRMAQGLMSNYQTNWAQAKTNFEGGVQRELDVAAKRRETANFMMSLALGAIPLKQVMEVFNKVQEVRGKLEGGFAALNVDKSRAGLGSKRHSIAPDKAADAGPAKAAAPGTNVEWAPLVDQLFASKEGFNSSLGGLTNLDHEYDSLIDKHAAGDITPDSALAKRAEQLASFSLPEPTGSFGAASDFFGGVESALAEKDIVAIERDMAMQWIAELKPGQINALDEVNGYFQTIGVTGPRSGKGLNFDGGLQLNNNEEQMLWNKARVQIEMQGLIGQHAEWLGGRKVGDNIQGTVRAANGNVYQATAKAGDDSKCWIGGAVVTEQPGGSVLVQKSKHANAGMPELATGEFYGSINQEQYLSQLRLGQFELVVVADGGNHSTNDSTVSRGASQ